MDISTEATFEDVLGFDFDPLGALADFVTDLSAIVANIVLRIVLGHLLK